MNWRFAAAVLLGAGLVLGLAPAAASAAAGEYDVEVEETDGVAVLDVAERTETVGGETYTVSSVAVAEPGADVRASVTAPEGAEYVVQLRGDGGTDLHDYFYSTGDDSGTLSTAGADPGSYAVAVRPDEFRVILPVVVAAYDVDLAVDGAASPPERVDADESLDVEVELDPLEAAPVDAVSLVVRDGDGHRTVSLASAGERTYAGTLDDLEPGEYELHVTVQGTEQVRDRQEVIALGAPWSLEVADSGSGGDGADDDGGDSGDDGDGSDDGGDDADGDGDAASDDGEDAGSDDGTDGEDGSDVDPPAGGDPPADDAAADDSTAEDDSEDDGTVDDGGDGAAGAADDVLLPDDGEPDGAGSDATPGFSAALAVLALLVASLARVRSGHSERPSDD